MFNNNEKLMNYVVIGLLSLLIISLLVTLIVILVRYTNKKSVLEENYFDLKIFKSDISNSIKKRKFTTWLLIKISDHRDFDEKLSSTGQELYIKNLIGFIKNEFGSNIKLVYANQLQSFIVFIPYHMSEHEIEPKAKSIIDDAAIGIVLNDRIKIKRQLTISIVTTNEVTNFDVVIDKLINMSIYQTKMLNKYYFKLDIEDDFSVESKIYQRLNEQINFKEYKYTYGILKNNNDHLGFVANIKLFNKCLSNYYNDLIKEQDLQWFTLFYVNDIIKKFIQLKKYTQYDLYIPIFNEILLNQTVLNELNKLVNHHKLSRTQIIFYALDGLSLSHDMGIKYLSTNQISVIDYKAIEKEKLVVEEIENIDSTELEKTLKNILN